ncbi:hypothetical protein QL285_087922 [Trifolium repens]|nr:hypothetical protein QL285_087922 [Trifolium repens]
MKSNQSPIFIGKSKAQFSLANQKPNLHWQSQFQSPIFIGKHNPKTQSSLANSIKAESSLANPIQKPNLHRQIQSKPNLRISQSPTLSATNHNQSPTYHWLVPRVSILHATYCVCSLARISYCIILPP